MIEVTEGGDTVEPAPLVDPASPLRDGLARFLVDFGAWAFAIVLCLGFAGAATWTAFRLTDTTDWTSDDLVENAERTVEPPPPPPPPPMLRVQDGAMIANPSWRIRPEPEFPRWTLARSGSAQLECQVSATGEITSCVILGETPARQGFGKAAVAAALKARLNPRTIDGVPTSGRVRFNCRFALE